MPRGGMSWAEAGHDIFPEVPPEPPRSTLIEMAVGELSARRLAISTSADELEEYGRKLHEDNFRRAALRRLLAQKKVERIKREADDVYVYYVNKQIVCTVDCTNAISDELLAQLGLALRFMPDEKKSTDAG